MNIYSLIVYALFTTAFVLSIISFLRVIGIYAINTFAKVLIAILTYCCSFIPIGESSVAMFLYSVFDVPSFLLVLICLLSIIRSFATQIHFVIRYKGFLFLFVMWIVFACNTLGFFEWAYGTMAYKIAITSVCIAIAYCFDRICGCLMLCSLIIWIPFSHVIDVYHAVFDGLICVCGCFVQSIPTYRNNFHIALLKPRIFK